MYMSTSSTTAATSNNNSGSNSDLADLSIMQLADSFFPTGMYTTSNGLEALFYSGRKLKPAEFTDLVRIFIERQMGPADTAALGNATGLRPALTLRVSSRSTGHSML